MADEFAGAPTAVLVVSSPDDGWCERTAVLLPKLIAWGVDAHVLVDGTDARAMAAFAQLPAELVCRRVHPPPHSLRAGPRPGLRRGLVHATMRNPLGVARQLGAWAPSADRYLRAVLLALGPHIVHVPSVASATRWAGPIALCRSRLVIGPCGGDGAFGSERPSSWRAVWDGADAVFVETAALVEVARLGPAGRVVGVIPPTPDPALLAADPPSLDDGPLRVLSMGPLSWSQGFEHSLQAIRLAADDGLSCSYRIVGTGAFIDALGFARHQLGVEELVEIGDLDESESGEHLSWAQVLVDPAVVPTSPRIVFSALARGIPVVTTQPPPGAEAAVLAIPRRDPQALAETLRRLAGDRELYRQLAGDGRAFSRRLRGQADDGETLAELYRSVAETSGRARPGRRHAATPS